jgi:hypothetical protein
VTRTPGAYGPHSDPIVLVVAHPARARFWRRLAGDAAWAPLEPRVVLDPDPAGAPSAWRALRHALELAAAGGATLSADRGSPRVASPAGSSAPPAATGPATEGAGPTHVVTVQDDAIPARGIGRALPRLLAAAGPDAVVCLYVGQHYRRVPHLREAAARGATLADLGHAEYTPTVATAWPLALLDDLLAFADRNLPTPSYRHDDELCGAWARSRGARVLATVPSIVQHDNDAPSVAGHSSHGARRAWCWIGEHDAATLDWRLA